MTHLLAMASRVLYDRELLALRSENNKLRLELFWERHSLFAFQRAMQCGNSFPAGAPDCRCRSCVLKERALSRRRRMGDADGAPCAFGPWFEAAAERYGLVIVRLDTSPEALEVWHHPASAEEASPMLDVDAHLVSIDGPDWMRFTYGRRLWGQTDADSAELARFAEFTAYLRKLPPWDAR